MSLVLVISVALVAAAIGGAYAPSTALACNPGRTPGSSTGGFSGTQRTLSTTPAGVKTRIETYDPHLHGTAAAWAWNMLTRPNASNGNQFWAQAGWAKYFSADGSWLFHSTFSSWTDNAGHYWVKYHAGAAVMGEMHYYYTYWTPGTLKFSMYYDSTTLDAGVTGGWTPTIVEIYGETHNYNTQMPGDTSNKVAMDNAYYLLSGSSTWHAIDSAAGANKPAWYGATKNSSTSYSIWDKACSTSGG